MTAIMAALSGSTIAGALAYGIRLLARPAPRTGTQDEDRA